MDACENRKIQILKLQDYDTYREQLIQDLQKVGKKLDAFCEQVSSIRQDYAKKLCVLVEESLIDLNFLDVKFRMEFKKMPDYTANGWDDDAPRYVLYDRYLFDSTGCTSFTIKDAQ